CLQDLQLPLTF
nr:immunoglobulin light chain junction region [Macaca mulatta]MOW08086.1 immunoglobulin light chain junction region [Macaca mulatta]MOW08352.1 immunoglobulin light chain junction region [Macaca mulatta]MOW08383.1 immunoglobulin light chain junction region [Macaca mulatta]MOW08405.1 immunoglobulin light chain junction region [Macaca mulatta]